MSKNIWLVSRVDTYLPLATSKIYDRVIKFLFNLINIYLRDIVYQALCSGKGLQWWVHMLPS
jgi:hypothetical protein